MTVVRAAGVQISPVLYSRDGTVERVLAKIDELAAHGAQFATFPETVVPYYPYLSFVQRPFEISKRTPEIDGAGGDHTLGGHTRERRRSASLSV